MSLMGTLAKVAIGVAVVKGAGALMQSRQNQTGSTGEGGLFGGAHSPGQAQSGGGLEDMLGGMLGGGAQGGSQGGGLGGLLESLGGGQAQGGGASGGFDDMLRQATQGGGLGDLLGGLGGAAASRPSGNNNADAGASNNRSDSFGKVLNQSLNRRGEPEAAPTQEQEAAAGLMLRAMIQAAKSDGKIDDAEREKLLGKLGDISAAEREFVTREMQAPVDVAGLARQVPKGLEQQVYAMSVLGIDLDAQAEAQYLHQLATAMSISQAQVNHIHDQLGVPKIYK